MRVEGPFLPTDVGRDEGAKIVWLVLFDKKTTNGHYTLNKRLIMTHRIRVAGLVRRGDSLLLVQQMNRHGKLLWSLPGGRLEASDENIFRAAEREVWEETGLKVEAGPLRFVSEYLSPDVFAVTLIVECQLAAGEMPQNIHLSNTQPDDHIYAVDWLSRSKIISDEKVASSIFTLDSFWDSLRTPDGVVYLGRWGD